jgi:hypothetical protein
VIIWTLSDNEVADIRSTLNKELARVKQIAAQHRREESRIKARGRELTIKHLLSSLEKTLAENEEKVDLRCYCDTNYDFYSKTLSISFRIGADSTIHREVIENIQPPPDEYLGIVSVLQELKKQQIKGRVQVITDGSRCAIALQMGLRYRVPSHSENQSPRSCNFGFTYDTAITLTKDLLENGCHVEYSYKNRGFINDALKLA